MGLADTATAVSHPSGRRRVFLAASRCDVQELTRDVPVLPPADEPAIASTKKTKTRARPGRAEPRQTLAQVDAQPSRLPPHPLVDTSAETRLRASFGQSMHDWLRLRFGVLGRVTDGVASPSSGAEVRTLLTWAREHGVQVLPAGGATSVAGHLTPVGAKP